MTTDPLPALIAEMRELEARRQELKRPNCYNSIIHRQREHVESQMLWKLSALLDAAEAKAQPVGEAAGLRNAAEQLAALGHELNKAIMERDHNLEVLIGSRGVVADLQAKLAKMESKAGRLSAELDCAKAMASHEHAITLSDYCNGLEKSRDETIKENVALAKQVSELQAQLKFHHQQNAGDGL
jgi:hypothetical protein